MNSSTNIRTTGTISLNRKNQAQSRGIDLNGSMTVLDHGFVECSKVSLETKVAIKFHSCSQPYEWLQVHIDIMLRHYVFIDSNNWWYVCDGYFLRIALSNYARVRIEYYLNPRFGRYISQFDVRRQPASHDLQWPICCHVRGNPHSF